MLKKTLLCCFVSMLFAGQAAASCALLEERSIMLPDNEFEVCTTLEEKLSFLRDNAIAWWNKEKVESRQDYWDEWAMKPKDNPVLSQNLSDKHFGLGFWLPDELENQVAKMTTEEWLKSHGVMFSLGFGDKKAGEPRMRFDYRWHDAQEADLMMQIEVPF
ncbi:hypothetical protein LZU85_10895 [Vibrio sp. IRLE0018]|uniref:hypothetical protein n=1 Tax=Vibrio floridensis TaxID=2908007 RepID=UPI001F28E646|nr:hypothetical protein [Vibrio floridensis]MCF8779307.1 hypothetical protein [Vibrio floridensis]